MTPMKLKTATLLWICLTIVAVATAYPAVAQTENVLWNFCSQPSCTDGEEPTAGMIADGAGNMYGTTSYGGAFGSGTVFELSPNGSGGWNYNVIYNFCSAENCADGGVPYSTPLIFDNAGNLYGTGAGGGAYGYGVVFELSPSGGGWTETVLSSFNQGLGGFSPAYGLAMDNAGNLYGITSWGGENGTGVVYEISPSGNGWTNQVIYNFAANDGGGGLAVNGGNVFVMGYLEVLELSPNGKGGWNESAIHTFAGPPKDGILAWANPVFDKAGDLYGVTIHGGKFYNGTVFKLTPKKKGKWTEKIINSLTDGSGPEGSVVFDAAGNIYGTTGGGGNSSLGTVYELVAPVGKGKYSEKILWNFNGSDGAYPESNLVFDNAGNLYGTTSCGGATYGGNKEYCAGNGAGALFEVTP